MWILFCIGVIPVVYLGGLGMFGKQAKRIIIFGVQEVVVFLGIIMLFNLVISPVVIAMLQIIAALLSGQSL